VMPFDGTQSFPASANISRVVNFTQRDYAYMRKGPGFRGTLVNIDLSSDPNIGHLNIDKSARLHARAITEIPAARRITRTSAGARSSAASSVRRR
jgi:hypothetical protein